jgi:hypothetical protein
MLDVQQNRSTVKINPMEEERRGDPENVIITILRNFGKSRTKTGLHIPEEI